MNLYNWEGVSYNSVLDIEFDDGEITEPVTLTEAKDFCKVDIGTDDDLIIALITAARQQCEAYTAVGFVVHDIVAIVNNSVLDSSSGISATAFIDYTRIESEYLSAR